MTKKEKNKKAPKTNSGEDLELLDMEKIGKKPKRKKTAFDYVRYAVMLVAAVVFVVAGYNLYSIFSEYAKGEQTYEDVANNFTNDTASDAIAATGDTVAASGFTKVNVDFANLQKANPDVKGWIQFEGLDISYPILQHPTDNEYYLKKMWDGNENTAGSIFMDVSNTADFQDANTFIYGHNMKNLSMFGKLKEYKDQANYAGKEYFWIYTPTANYRYVIYSIHEAKVDGGMFRTFVTQSDEFTQYLAQSKADSRYDTGVAVSGEDQIVTLSTCTATGDKWRLLVQGKLVGTELKVLPGAEEEGAAE